MEPFFHSELCAENGRFDDFWWWNKHQFPKVVPIVKYTPKWWNTKEEAKSLGPGGVNGNYATLAIRRTQFHLQSEEHNPLIVVSYPPAMKHGWKILHVIDDVPIKTTFEQTEARAYASVSKLFFMWDLVAINKHTLTGNGWFIQPFPKGWVFVVMDGWWNWVNPTLRMSFVNPLRQTWKESTVTWWFCHVKPETWQLNPETYYD